ncbi:aldehyde dehydrogenase family protein [Streptomyces viridiviolaceus]|uniref:Aldehyde dehydrogenase family protein n=1 Tax=Streptomyces viridiviolaceus TaxID=68282 RepID=A0ABW2E5Y8_9ACTN
MWNFPEVLAFFKLASALAAGCTVVMKPSWTRSGHRRPRRSRHRAGLPPRRRQHRARRPRDRSYLVTQGMTVPRVPYASGCEGCLAVCPQRSDAEPERMPPMTDGVATTELWALVEEAEIEALAGGPADTQRFTVGGAIVLLGPSGSAVITVAGDALGHSGVWSAEEVRQVGPAPAPVTKRLLGGPEAWGADESSLPTHLAVRLAEGLLYLGTGRLRHAETTRPAGGGEPVLESCLLRIHTRLSRPVLERVRPPRPAPDLPDLGWLEHVNEDRAVALEQFVTGWYPAVEQPQHPSSVPAGSRSLPGSLQQLYLPAEQRPDVLGRHNHILPWHEVLTDPLGALLVFGVENQGGFYWGLPWTLDEPEDDPAVWFCEFDEKPIAEQEPLSGFLLQFSLFEAAMSAHYVGLADSLSDRQVQQLTAPLQRVPLRPFWPQAHTRFYVAPGLVLYVGDAVDDGKFDLWAGATHRSALQAIPESDVKWIRFDG